MENTEPIMEVEVFELAATQFFIKCPPLRIQLDK